jgi:hypothetical protein
MSRFVENEGHAQKTAVTAYMEIAEVKELPGAYLVANYGQFQMNMVFMRASIFSEGLFGFPQGSVVKWSEIPDVFRAVGGHDIPSKTLIEFYQAVTEKCKTDPEYCLSKTEEEVFTEFILPRAAEGTDFVLVTYAILSAGDYNEVALHELYHAQYFLDPGYRAVVDEFWRDALTESERQSVRLSLSVIYDPSNELLMANELQAYMLQPGGEKNLMTRTYIPLFKQSLGELLTEAGHRPLLWNKCDKLLTG